MVTQEHIFHELDAKYDTFANLEVVDHAVEKCNNINNKQVDEFEDIMIKNQSTFQVENLNSDRSKVAFRSKNTLFNTIEFQAKRYIKTIHVQRRIKRRNANNLFILLRIVVCFVSVKQWMWLCVLFGYVCAFKEQRFAIEPQDQTAVIGSRVILPCRVESKTGQLQWTKDDFGLGTHRHLTGYERYKMIGSDEEGDYSLDIHEVTLDDDALYQCQVSSGPRGEPAIRSRYARLLVLVPPDGPKIMQGSVLHAVEDREVDLECMSVGGKPAAEITWVDNDGGVLNQGVTYSSEPMLDGRRFTARSVLRLRPRKHHHNQTFTCQAQNTADRAYRATTIKLQVQYAPKVKISVKPGLQNGRAQEGETITIGCQATANPDNLTYLWHVNNEEVAGSYKNYFVITNISRKYNEATIKCEVHNSVGKSADTKTLEVTYGPSFVTKPKNVEGEVGSTATLSCVVDGHPPPRVTWLRYQNEKVIRVGKSENLTLRVNQQTAGQYWCRVSIDGHQDIEASAVIYVKGPPKIISNLTQYGIEGDSVRIECISFSIPKPDYVIWAFEGIEIDSFHNQEYAFLEESLTDKLTKSTLIIRESQKRHFGIYNCTVTNFYGTDSVEIRLIPDKSSPIILIIISCALIATLVLMIMLIIMLCYRKTRQSEKKKPDITDIGKKADFKDSDRSSNISDLKLELRQVEGSLNNSNGESDPELHSTLHLTTNLGLPLAGPVSLSESGYDNELLKQYQRYSGDFNQPINKLHFKAAGSTNGYIPYVDYSRDYAPPGDSLTGSLTRSTDSTFPSHCGSLHRQGSCGRLPGLVGPDVIPMSNVGVIPNGMDARFAATYGNPYLRGSGPITYISQNSVPNSGTKAPPPYYSVRNSNINLAVTSVTSPSSSSSSKPVTSPMPSSSSANSGARPQVPKMSSGASSGALYILSQSGKGNAIQTAQGGSQLKNGTHV